MCAKVHQGSKVELHIIQSFAPSCLNRDDTNAVKDCEFGLHRRVRVSSQCIKRAIRTSPVFSELVGSNTAVRTKLLVSLLSDGLKQRGVSTEEVDKVVPLFVDQYVVLEAGAKTKVLLYLGSDEIDRIVDRLCQSWGELLPVAEHVLAELAAQESKKSEGKGGKREKKENALTPIAKKLFAESIGATSAVDIALFGRMIAESKDHNVDAACQVAHAISTHRANIEMDFYTAVDDISKESGAGMMGTTEFASACFYRYSLLDFEQLVRNLGNDQHLARKAVRAYLMASIMAIPTGKQTSTAPQSPPSFVMAVVRESGFPQSLANAFEEPVYPRGNSGVVAQSILRLDDYWGRVVRMYGTDGVKLVTHCMINDVPLTNLRGGTVESVMRLVEQVEEALA